MQFVARICFILASALFTVIPISSAVAAELIQGPVVGITDGDTLTVLVNRKPVQVRLVSIDAPEARQAFGDKARRSLAEICFSKQAIVRVTGKHFRRVVGEVMCDGVNANATQVERGMAWVHRRYARSSSPLFFLQDQAQRSREGLWADRSPLAPWLWRKR